MRMRTHWLYLKAVLRHKRFVYEEGRKLGLTAWRCLIHDWQKFMPIEWFPYANAFYGSGGGKTGKPQGDRAFDRAWHHHQKFGPHHWQHWIYVRGGWEPYHQMQAIDLGILMEDSGKIMWLSSGKEIVDPDVLAKLYAEPMPDKYRREMLADWRGANRAYGDKTLAEWYAWSKDARRLHSETQAWIEAQPGVLA